MGIIAIKSAKELEKLIAMSIPRYSLCSQKEGIGTGGIRLGSSRSDPRSDCGQQLALFR